MFLPSLKESLNERSSKISLVSQIFFLIEKFTTISDWLKFEKIVDVSPCTLSSPTKLDFGVTVLLIHQ